jgi:DNA-binding GntR family transcriptional regulator
MAKSRDAAEQLAELVGNIRRDITFGAYEPGAWLKLTTLQRQHGASAFQIRRALDELKSSKLVDHQANAGFRVASPDDSTRAETRFMRTLLEGSAASFIVARADAANVAELQRLATAFEATIGQEGRQTQASANYNFHTYMYSLTGNTVLSEMIGELRNRSPQPTTGRWRSVEGLRESNRDHFAMIEAIKARDPYELQRVIARHIEAF